MSAIEQLKWKYELKYYLPPDTEEKVIIIGACLIGESNEVIVKAGIISTRDQELSDFLNVIKWLGVDNDFYQVVDDYTILFINGSRIDFITQ